MISVNKVSKSFLGIEVLKDVSFSIQEGEIYGIIGHSGAGKSTLLRCINGLESYDSGSVKIMGKEIKSLTNYEIRELRKDLGMIFQNFNLLERKTVFENIALPLEIWKKKLGLNNDDIRNRVIKLLEIVDLKEKINDKPKSLSGGQKQRVAIARALALNPKILLCDEATSALDPRTTKDILQLLLKINKELNITMVIVTHQMEVIKEICENITLLGDGKVIASGKADELFLKPGEEFKKFLGENDIEILPKEGVNIKIFFPKNCSENAVITKLARDKNIDFSIVWGKLEKFRDSVLGSLVINVKEENKKVVLDYLKERNVEWEEI